MICDSGKIRALRERLGYTQELLATKAGIDRRTIQRAESSNRALQLETAAQLAAALQVSVQELKFGGEVNGSAPAPESVQVNAVVLKRTLSGKAVVDALLGAFSARLECDIDPDAEQAAPLIEFVKELEKLAPDPWDLDRLREGALSLSERIEWALRLSSHMAQLDAAGIGVFAGNYTASALVPRYDSDEGCLYTRTTQKPEPQTVCLVRIGPSTTERHVVSVADRWELDDEFPF
jgi:transcriptional regulator with XRE-family HTH domain